MNQRATNLGEQRIETIEANNSHSVIEYPLSLSTQAAQKLFEQQYTRVRNHLYHLTVATPNRAPGDDAVKLIVDMIDEDLDSLEKGMIREIDRVDIVCDKNGIAARARGTKPVSYSVEVDSPRARRYLEVLSSLDSVLLQLQTLYLMGIVKDQENTSTTRRWTGATRKFRARLEDWVVRYARYEKQGLHPLSDMKVVPLKVAEPNDLSEDNSHA